MHEGPVAAFPVQLQPNRHIIPLAMGELQGQVPLLTQSSNSSRRTMPEPVPLLRSDPAASRAPGWMELRMDISSPCDAARPHLEQSEYHKIVAHGGGQQVEVSDLGSQAAEYLKHCEAVSPQQEDESTNEVPSAGDRNSCNHLPVSEESSLDLLRIAKRKPSAIVFCDYDCSSGTRKSSSSTAEEGEYHDDGSDDEDDFPETLQYKEFLVSRRRRNSSRNRKGLRKRQDAHPKSAASGWRKLTNEGKPEFTGSQEQQETPSNNGNQVRKTRGE